MKKISQKRKFIFISIILCLLAFAFPFCIRTCEDSLFSVLSLSLAAVGTVATLITLIVAILLYDRFGLEGKFIERQTDKVLELVDLLKGKAFYVHATGGTYIIRPSMDFLSAINQAGLFDKDKRKIILISYSDYDEGTKNILALQRSYWLPKEIKEKISFLDFGLTKTIDEPLSEKYCRLFFDDKTNKEWVLPYPEIKFEELHTDIYNLVRVIDQWLKQHSGISLDLKLEEGF